MPEDELKMTSCMMILLLVGALPSCMCLRSCLENSAPSLRGWRLPSGSRCGPGTPLHSAYHVRFTGRKRDSVCARVVDEHCTGGPRSCVELSLLVNVCKVCSMWHHCYRSFPLETCDIRQAPVLHALHCLAPLVLSFLLHFPAFVMPVAPKNLTAACICCQSYSGSNAI